MFKNGFFGNNNSINHAFLSSDARSFRVIWMTFLGYDFLRN